MGEPGERFETGLTARVFDANSDFYERTGVKDEFVLDGKELVIQAGAWASIEGEVLGQTVPGRLRNFYERNPATYTPPSLIRPDLTVPPSSNTRVEVQGAR